jgi:DNA polymerase elongation subunit (family B)
VALIEKLEKKLKYLELAYTLAYESLTPFDRVYSSIALLQGLILKELHSQNKVLPDKTENEHIPFPGAYVYAKAGAYDNVISFDIESLYPHNIMAFNISPETLVVAEETEKIERLKTAGKLISTPVGRKEGFIYEEQKVTFDNIYYDGNKKGILPIVVKKIFDERKKFKALSKQCKKEGDKKGHALNERLQYTRKILANSLYGVIANPHFCLYNVKNAMAVTLGGQDLIQYLSKIATDYLMNVGYKGVKAKKDPLVLVDTDSAHYCVNYIFQNTKKKEETFLEWGKEIEKDFFAPFWNKLLSIHAEKFNIENIMNFRRDCIASKYMILAKKKYAVEILDKEGETFPEPKVSITGIEIVRKDTPSFCREKILEVVKRIFSINDRNDIMEFLKEIKKDFKKENATNIAIPKGISDYEKYAKKDEYYEKNGLSYPPRCPIHVRAAINYNYINRKYKLGGLPIYNGTKMKYIHVTPKNEIRQDVVGFIGNYPEAFKEKFIVDYDHQWERSLQDIIERFFIVLGWGQIDLQAQNLNAFMEW